MRVIIDESAWSDLDDIALGIARDNVAAARREVEKIRHVIGLLGVFPGLSRNGRAKGTRERVVSDSHYVIVFEMWENPRALVVTGVVHGRAIGDGTLHNRHIRKDASGIAQEVSVDESWHTTEITTVPLAVSRCTVRNDPEAEERDPIFLRERRERV